ncbi:MAG: farnesyl diphosphate synthase [Pyramidobacter sp.]|nr:farnesyl diphosphate synthase [Pyramidobacter sp.]
MAFKDELKLRTEFFEHYMNAFCSEMSAEIPPRLKESMTYSLLAGGKRIRPVLCISGAQLFGLEAEKVLPMALAFEMVHTASLIHDDLPCMDNDTMRRGKPTNHVVFGETLALLAGDALFFYAFESALSGLTKLDTPPQRALRALSLFADALGPRGICGGQVLDTDAQSQSSAQDFVMNIASMKTMVLICAALASGAVLAGADGEDLRRVTEYGRLVGIAFQVADDILDCTGDPALMGKTLGKDEVQDKKTFVHAYGLDGARRRLRDMTDESIALLEPFGERAAFLKDLAVYLESRTR